MNIQFLSKSHWTKSQLKIVIIYFFLNLNRIRATDTTNVTSRAIVNNVLICDCRSLSTLNKCIYSSVQQVINPYVNSVSCSCDKNFNGNFFFLLYFIWLSLEHFISFQNIGTRCENKIDFCSFADYCNLFPGLNPISTCTSLSSTEQESTGLLYTCTGNCSPGFTKNRNGACIGQLFSVRTLELTWEMIYSLFIHNRYQRMWYESMLRRVYLHWAIR